MTGAPSHPGAAALLAVLAACAGAPRIELAELPAAPLAIRHLDAEQARRRVERLRDQKHARVRAPGILYLDDLDALLGGGAAASRRSEPAEGRLVWLDPRAGSVTPIASAVPGARPLARSPDGRELLFAAPWRGGSHQLFVLERDSGNVRPLTYGPHAHPMGCYAGPHALAAVELGVAGGQARARIVLAPRAGGAARPLTPGPYDLEPACAPDGARVAYTTRRAGGGEAVAVIATEPGSEPRLVANGRDPVFTPDGAWIVYSARTSAGPRLWRMRPDGSGKLALGQGRSDERRPAVSPDGRFVAYLAAEEDRLRARVRRLDGTGDRLLLEAGDALDVVW